jgi:methanogenic corrinoid protein MtbC1
MDLFSISQLSRFSGIKPHTIRIWEQRYNALRPLRSEGNTRYYDNGQLRRLLNIVSLMDRDHKVSELCSMPDKMLFSLIEETVLSKTSVHPNVEYFITQLIAAGLAYDEHHFEKIFANCLVRFGWKDTYVQVLYPMLSRIGLMWTSDAIPPSNEHFISNLIRQKLFSAIDALPPPAAGAPKWLLFLQEGEFHEIGLLFACYLVRQAGHTVIYLGPDLPYESLVEAGRNTNPAFLLFFIVHQEDTSHINRYLDQLKQAFVSSKIYVAADERMMQDIKPGKKIVWIKSVHDLENQLTSSATP